VEPGTSTPPAAVAAQPAPPTAQQAAQQLQTQDPGFRSRGSFEDHYRKHGREFGAVSADEYLALAQRLRDAPVGGDILEIVREVDGVITRYDRSNQHFGAYNRDGTIRTFFIPNDGESYFRRQALRRPQ
jgi:pyocin large subunit-like protein